jgi:hypothetical protein
VPRLGEHETRLPPPHARPPGRLGVVVTSRAVRLAAQREQLLLMLGRLAAVEQREGHTGHGHGAKFP